MTATTIPEHIFDLVAKRDQLRREKKYQEADTIRKEIEDLGYILTDTPAGAQISNPQQQPRISNSQPILAIFGSGELSTIGRQIHEYLVKDLPTPLSIALLETPAGYEDNPHNWYTKLEEMLLTGLRNFHPTVTRITALRRNGNESTNDETILGPLTTAHYIHTGAGSPTYATKHLRESKALAYIVKRMEEGYSLSVASASAIAFSRYVLPVYEIYFCGHDLHWEEGLNVFGKWGLNMTIIPHWNNKEGGKTIDTRFAYMGGRRFSLLLEMLPAPTTVVGIDEHTALILEFAKKEALVMGKGKVTLLKGKEKQAFSNGQRIPFSSLS